MFVTARIFLQQVFLLSDSTPNSPTAHSPSHLIHRSTSKDYPATNCMGRNHRASEHNSQPATRPSSGCPSLHHLRLTTTTVIAATARLEMDCFHADQQKTNPVINRAWPTHVHKDSTAHPRTRKDNLPDHSGHCSAAGREYPWRPSCSASSARRAACRRIDKVLPRHVPPDYLKTSVTKRQSQFFYVRLTFDNYAHFWLNLIRHIMLYLFLGTLQQGIKSRCQLPKSQIH